MNYMTRKTKALGGAIAAGILSGTALLMPARDAIAPASLAPETVHYLRWMAVAARCVGWTPPDTTCMALCYTLPIDDDAVMQFWVPEEYADTCSPDRLQTETGVLIRAIGVPFECAWADRDHDGDVDLLDFAKVSVSDAEFEAYTYEVDWGD